MTTKNSTKSSALFINELVEEKFHRQLNKLYKACLKRNTHNWSTVIVTLPAHLYRMSNHDSYSPIIWKFVGDVNCATIRLWEPGRVPYHDLPDYHEVFKLRAQ